MPPALFTYNNNNHNKEPPPSSSPCDDKQQQNDNDNFSSFSGVDRKFLQNYNNNNNNVKQVRHADSYKHPERFWVTYIIEAVSEQDARKIAWEVCLEQTVELPEKIDSVQHVLPYVVGKVERIEDITYQHQQRSNDGTILPKSRLYRVSIAYPNDTAGDELTQFINVVFGNTSLKPGIAVSNVILSHHLSDNTTMFPGPKFGIQGLRELLGVPQAPLLCTALKPMGSTSQELASMAYKLARGGIDIIKDDHGLADQVWAPFEERVSLCAAAVRKANDESGGKRRCIYAPCLNAPASKIVERAFFAKQAGAGAVMILPGISGFDVIRELASNPMFGLPILIHPAMLGGWLHTSGIEESTNHPSGLSHEFLFGVLPRLCGGDAVIFPNSGGRFQFTTEQCQAVAEGCRRPMGRFEPILPAPAGGMKLNRVNEMRGVFGDDTLFLIGGALLEEGPDLELDAQAFLHSAGRDDDYSPPRILGDSSNNDVLLPNPENKTNGIGNLPLKVENEDQCSIANVERVAFAVRRRVLEYTLRNNGGYLSQACSSAETLATLYLRALNLGPSLGPPVPGKFLGSPGPHVATINGEAYNGDATNPHLDRLIFSPVHYALVLYALLVEIGRLDVAAFEQFNKDGSKVELIGAEHSPGHAVTAGSLAQAMSQGAGIAYGRKLKHHTGRVVVYMSDGEFQEGQTWETVQMMVYHKISNLTAVVDVNGQQCDGKMNSVMAIGDIAVKLRAFGANVHEVDGHNVWDIEKACKHTDKDKPTFVLCYTDPCHGFSFLKERAPNLHYVRFKDESEKESWEKILSEMKPLATDGEAMASSDIQQQEKNYQVKSDGEEIMNDHKYITIDTTEKVIPEVQGIETVTRPHRAHLVEWAKAHPRAIVLTADLTSSCEADLLRDTLPNQYLSCGMAEQNMISFAGGLAREGFRPFIHTFGVFLTRRPFDQVAMSIGVPNLPVRMLGFLPGITTPGGVTHQAIDDVALMRSIPNMRILECGDATEVESVLDVADSIDGPVYIRMLRGEVPRLFPKSQPMKLGVAKVLSEGTDILLVTTGICTEEALKARGILKWAGIGVTHLHLSTINPFPSNCILDAGRTVKYGIISMENHSIVGGIGTAIAEILAEAGLGKRLIRLGIPGVYAHGASCPYLMAEYGIDAKKLVETVEKLVGKKLSGSNGCPALGDASTNEVKISAPSERPEDL